MLLELFCSFLVVNMLMLGYVAGLNLLCLVRSGLPTLMSQYTRDRERRIDTKLTLAPSELMELGYVGVRHWGQLATQSNTIIDSGRLGLHDHFATIAVMLVLSCYLWERKLIFSA